MTNQDAKRLGKLGGEATKRKYGKNHFKRLGKRGGIAKAKKKQNTS